MACLGDLPLFAAFPSYVSEVRIRQVPQGRGTLRFLSGSAVGALPEEFHGSGPVANPQLAHDRGDVHSHGT